MFCRLCPYFLTSQSCLVLCSLHLIPYLCRDLECFWWGQYLHAAQFKWPCLVLMFISLTIVFRQAELFKDSPSWRISLFCLKWLHSSLVSFKVLFFSFQPGAYFWTILSRLILTLSLKFVNTSVKWRVGVRLRSHMSAYRSWLYHYPAYDLGQINFSVSQLIHSYH